jgi:hypothetical protein
MQLVLGVRGISRGEVELLRSILRLSSNLLSRWTLSENQPGDLLLVEGEASEPAVGATASQAVVVPLVARHDTASGTGPVLHRPIYAEELVKLLNDVDASVAKARPATAAVRLDTDRARLKRWPSKAGLLQRGDHIRLATALTRGTHSAASLCALTGVDTAECTRFLDLLDREGLLGWQCAEPLPTAGFLDTQPGDALGANPRRGLMSRIRRRLGLA